MTNGFRAQQIGNLSMDAYLTGRGLHTSKMHSNFSAWVS